MRLVVIALTLVSVTLAGTTVYFARELQLERDRPHVTPVALAQTKPAIPARSLLPAAVPRAATQPASNSSSTVGGNEEGARRMQAEQSRRILKVLADPAQREDLLVESKLNMRNSYPRLAQVLGLTNEEADRLFTLLAQQQLDSQEAYSRCMVDPDCNIRDMNTNQPDPRAQEIADLLGADRQQQFEAYKNTLMERESVVQLRSRLPDSSRLPDDRAEALIAVLADERQKIHMEAAQRGAGMNGYGSGVGVIFSASDAPTAEAQIASAQANSRRMHDRAAEVLNTEQLRVFDEMQEELMISMRNQARRKADSASTTS